VSRGRSFCTDVSSYECEAPAGIRTGRGTAAMPGVKRSDLHTCAYCQEAVCGACSDTMTPPASFKDQSPVRVCLSHAEHELAHWLGVA
jgi:hypothetical protein